jgi:DNA-binding NarL/FixJ family response regulator
MDTGEMKLKLGICEDDSFTRSTLEAALRFEGLEVLFSAGSAAEAQKFFLKNPPHAMLIDLHLGQGPNGLELARELRKQKLNLGIVFLSSLESPKLLDRMRLGLPSGAQFLKKEAISNVAELVSALQKSLKIGGAATPSSGLVSELTPRQLEVLELVANGKSNQEIAQLLGVTGKSIEALVTRIAKHLEIAGAQSSNQRVQMAKAYIRAIGGIRDSV